MAKDSEQKPHRIDGWREKRAAKRALKGDSPEKLRDARSAAPFRGT